MLKRLIVFSLLVFVPLVSFAQYELLYVEDATGKVVGVVLVHHVRLRIL